MLLCLGPGSDNDNIGLIINRYYAADNFGIGPHAADSIRNPSGGDIDTNRDFNLRYRIEQLSVTPPTTRPPAQLPTAPTQPPSYDEMINIAVGKNITKTTYRN